MTSLTPVQDVIDDLARDPLRLIARSVGLAPFLTIVHYAPGC